jgi:hypothetical protein
MHLPASIDHWQVRIDRAYAVARVAPDSACGSMVLADLLCAVFPRCAEKPHTFEMKSTVLPKAKTPTAYVL